MTKVKAHVRPEDSLQQDFAREDVIGNICADKFATLGAAMRQIEIDIVTEVRLKTELAEKIVNILTAINRQCFQMVEWRKRKTTKKLSSTFEAQAAAEIAMGGQS